MSLLGKMSAQKSALLREEVSVGDVAEVGLHGVCVVGDGGESDDGTGDGELHDGGGLLSRFKANWQVRLLGTPAHCVLLSSPHMMQRTRSVRQCNFDVESSGFPAGVHNLALYLRRVIVFDWTTEFWWYSALVVETLRSSSTWHGHHSAMTTTGTGIITSMFSVADHDCRPVAALLGALPCFQLPGNACLRYRAASGRLPGTLAGLLRTD
ncbi:unnamed protein product [Phytophthora fragariaefolia]|uniref:Unnamed protein product n=1 Tax=Phytophthora fragariaefolia TaxID=1490495 RepID=A0A9W6YL84_9STRA|nr:unnamed protein product [Phytophthora fragariaefolia]